MPRRWYGAPVAALLLVPAAAVAQQTRAGAEFRVNTFTTDSQRRPDVLFRSNGEFIVTWTGVDPLDGSAYGIIAQRYDAPPTSNNGDVREVIEEQFSEYRSVDGLQVAFAAVLHSGGQKILTRRVRTFEYNVPLLPDLFTRPS